MIGILEYYMIGVTILGFVLYGINVCLHKYTEKMHIDIVVNVIAVAGGSLGILLAILIMDRKTDKENIMTRVIVICLLVIQVICYIFFKGNYYQNMALTFTDFFDRFKYALGYLLIINVITFITYGIDKYKAIKEKERIKIVTLLVLAFIGGTVGGLLAMYLFRHKTKKDYFVIGLPLILVMQFVVVFFLTQMI